MATDEEVETHRPRVDRDPPRFDLGDVQDIVHEL